MEKVTKTKSIAVAGKGGTGKSTLAALLILQLREWGQGPVLAIDADPDANLGSLLGVEPQKAVGDLREEVLKEFKDLPAGMTKANYVEAGLHQIIEEAEGFDLITMGRGEGPGCYCYLNSLIRKFYTDLTPSYAWAVIDNEAGLEHLSRRTTARIDALIVVVNENPLSLNTARKVEAITGTIQNEIKHKYLVTNMVREEQRAALRRQMADLSLEYLGDIPQDPQLQEIVFRGEPLSRLDTSPVKDHIQAILRKIGGIHGHT